MLKTHLIKDCYLKYIKILFGSNFLFNFFFFLSFVFCLFVVVVVAISWAAPAAYGGSQARG